MKMYEYDSVNKLNQGLLSLLKSGLDVIKVTVSDQKFYVLTQGQKYVTKNKENVVPEASPNPRPVKKGG